jgi:hypothetical protein
MRDRVNRISILEASTYLRTQVITLEMKSKMRKREKATGWSIILFTSKRNLKIAQIIQPFCHIKTRAVQMLRVSRASKVFMVDSGGWV